MEISPALANEIRDRIAISTGLDRGSILLHNIHTHSAPRFGGASAEFGGTNYMYKLRAVDAIVSNAVRTVSDDKSFREFSMETGRTVTDIAGNRCEKGGPLDSSVYAVRFLDRKGKPICALINLACHPVCMGPWSLQLSSDYSGAARKIVSENGDVKFSSLPAPQATSIRQEVLRGLRNMLRSAGRALLHPFPESNSHLCRQTAR